MGGSPLLRNHLLPQQTQLNDNAKHWNSIIKFHTKQRDDPAIIKSYQNMEALGLLPDHSTLPLVLKACGRLQAVELGKRIHNCIKNVPLIEDVRVRTALIDFYWKCGMVRDAGFLFDEMSDRDLVSWNAMITGFVGSFLYEEAIALCYEMQNENLRPNAVTLVGLLSACAALWDFELGREIHCYSLRNGLSDTNLHVVTSLIGFYARFDIEMSRYVFDSMAARNTVCWNAMISGYFSAGESPHAMDLFVQMLINGAKPCSVTALVTVQSCADLGCLALGKQVHQVTIKCGFSSDICLENALVDMYAKAGCLESSVKIFENMQMRDIAAWNCMLSAYKSCEYYEEGIRLFTWMQMEGIRGNIVTIAIMLLVCAQCSSVKNVKALHAYILRSGMEMDLSVANALLSAYADLNCVESATNVFFGMTNFDVVSWNTLITVLVYNKFKDRAWKLVGWMRKTNIRPNSFTMVALLAGCQGKTNLNIGRSIHGYIVKHGLIIDSSLCTALTNMYVKCGYESAGKFIFDISQNRDLISWNSAIASYVEIGQPDMALSLLQRMQLEMEPDLVTALNVLPACSHLANLSLGKSIHGFTIRRILGAAFDTSLENVLLTMYSKCGSIQYAVKIFQNLSIKDSISWNSMIAGYGMHGLGREALLIFSQMKGAGVTPTSVTFVSLLSACSHSGLVEEGWELFHTMQRDYHIIPEVVHYACIVDILSRAGQLYKAKSLIDSMPMEPDACVWRALLGGCRLHSNIELVRSVTEQLIELEPMNIANYILLSNIHAAGGNWPEVRRVRAEIVAKGLKKVPGISWINIVNEVHSFWAADNSHPDSGEIYGVLDFLTANIMENGYVPDVCCVLPDLND